LLARYKMDFVRVAVLPEQLHTAECRRAIERAKELGMIVSLNVMQSYASTPSELAASAKELAGHGLEWVYLGDSGGGMLPDEVKEYTRAVLDASGIQVGLHAHNNSGLALANSL